MDAFSQIPVGRPIPDSLHAVSLSLPTMQHVRGYEEKSPNTMQHIRSGYPRFVTHHLIEECKQRARTTHGLPDRAVYCLNSSRALRELTQFAGEPEAVREESGVAFAFYQAGSEAAKRAHQFLQHTGVCVSSRRAEDGLNDRLRSQESAAAARQDILKILGEAHETDSSDVFLTTSGLNAFFTVFRELQRIQKAKGRTLWLQLGWLYVDTGEILKKFTESGDCAFIANVFDLETIRRFVHENRTRIAGIVTECPTNPLVEMTDIEALYGIAREAGAALILDPTLVTPLNIHMLPHADAVINSLTKYASHMGDVMIGSAVLNPQSPFYEDLKTRVPESIEEPYAGDLIRLGEQIQDYPAVVEKINASAMKLAEFLSSHKNVRRVFWAYETKSRSNYEKFQKRSRAPGGIITIELNLPLEKFYDRIAVAKGPSFGCVFTLICPFMYLAHYDLVQSEQGRAQLKASNLDPDLVRISVGVEPIDDLIAEFGRALAD